MDKTAIQELIGAINRPMDVEIDSEHHVVIVPEGYNPIDMRPFMPPPDEVRDVVALTTVEDFIAYMVAYALPDRTAVFADEETATFVGVVDYHGRGALVDKDGQSGRCIQQARYTCPESAESKLWRASNAKTMSQTVFAQFIEENAPDIASPPGAEMLELATHFQVHKKVKFESELRLADGQRQLQYVEEIQATARPGKVTVPDRFILDIPLFIGGERFNVTARLRYRMEGGTLGIFYELHRFDEVRRNAIGKLIAQVKGKLPFTLRGKR